MDWDEIPSDIQSHIWLIKNVSLTACNVIYFDFDYGYLFSKASDDTGILEIATAETHEVLSLKKKEQKRRIAQYAKAMTRISVQYSFRVFIHLSDI